MASCPRCGLRYRPELRRAKVMPCGHSACAPCLRELMHLFVRAEDGAPCPVCGATFKSDEDLVENLDLMHLGEHCTGWTYHPLSMWCERCDAEAQPACFEDAAHALCPTIRLQREARAELAALYGARGEALDALGAAVQAGRCELNGLAKELPRIDSVPSLTSLLAEERARHPPLTYHCARLSCDALQLQQQKQQQQLKQQRGDEDDIGAATRESQDGFHEENDVVAASTGENPTTEDQEVGEDVPEGGHLGAATEKTLERLRWDSWEEREEEEDADMEASGNRRVQPGPASMLRRNFFNALLERKPRFKPGRPDQPYCSLSLEPQDHPQQEDEFLDQDDGPATAPGILVQAPASPPQQHAAAAAAVRAGAVGLSSLSDETLAMVLCFLVPTAEANVAARELFPLRLVSRQWDRVVCSPRVWRHRALQRLYLPSQHHRHNRQCPRVSLTWLRRVPCLDSVSASVSDGDRDALLALADSRCEVRSLRLFGSVTGAASEAIVAVLVAPARRASLVELDLGVSLAALSSAGACDEMQLLDLKLAVEGLQGLRTLRMGPAYGIGSSAEEDGAEREWKLLFYSPLPITELTLRGTIRANHYPPMRMSKTMAQSLVYACRGTLRVAHCGDHDVVEELAECDELREVTLLVPQGSLHALHALPCLQKLNVHCRDADHVRMLGSFLQSPALTVSTVRLFVDSDEAATALLHLPVAAGLCRVSHLQMDAAVVPDSAALLRCADAMPELRVLVVPRVTLASLLREWPDDGATAGAWLERLEVLHAKSCCQTIPRLKRLRPNLKVCTPRCSKKHL